MLGFPIITTNSQDSDCRGSDRWQSYQSQERGSPCLHWAVVHLGEQGGFFVFFLLAAELTMYIKSMNDMFSYGPVVVIPEAAAAGGMACAGAVLWLLQHLIFFEFLYHGNSVFSCMIHDRVPGPPSDPLSARSGGGIASLYRLSVFSLGLWHRGCQSHFLLWGALMKKVVDVRIKLNVIVTMWDSGCVTGSYWNHGCCMANAICLLVGIYSRHRTAGYCAKQ